MIHLMPSLARNVGNRSMKKISLIWPKVWMKAGSGAPISFRNGLVNA